MALLVSRIVGDDISRMGLVSALLEILQRPTVWDVMVELMLFVAPFWISVLIGVLVGWSWKPNWAANLWTHFLDFVVPQNPSSSPLQPISSLNDPEKVQLPSSCSSNGDDPIDKGRFPPSPIVKSGCSSSQLETGKPALVNEGDFRHLYKLVEVTDGGPAWIQMMDRSSPTMCYQAWRRDPQTGPPQYRSRTVFEDASPELVRDFFWDDSFRSNWDDMLLQATTLEECGTTGTLIVHWVRKFPFFCSDREYVIGRRIWVMDNSYYCVTKGIQSTAVPRRSKPRRVDLYYSSWCIRAVESKRGDQTACEVLLFHHEDMGIPWEIAKLGVRQGMWGTVKKIEPGLRAYLKERASGASLSPCAIMAQINTRVSADYLKSLESPSGDNLEADDTLKTSEKPPGMNMPKLLVVGGAIVLACSLDKGLLTKAVIFGAVRKFAWIGKRL